MDTFEQALAVRSPEETEGRALIALALAACRVAQGEPEEAVRVASSALTAARKTLVTPIARKVQEVRTGLVPWEGEPFLAKFDETLSTALPGSAGSSP